MQKMILLGIFFLGSLVLPAQEHFPSNGVADSRPEWYAFTQATIYVSPDKVLTNATLVIREGRVTAVGTDIEIPRGAQVRALEGKYIYPAFVDPYTSYGLPKVKESSWSFGDPPQYESVSDQPIGWNDAVKSQFNAVASFVIDKKAAKSLRKAGFGTVATLQQDGIIRGTSTFVALIDDPVNEAILEDKVAQHFSFDRGSSKQTYPNSIMGMVALIRQTYLDAKWYNSVRNQGLTDLSLKAFSDNQTLPQIFEANANKLRVLLADQVGDEMGTQYIIKGNGDEYQRLDDILATKAPLIIPVNFPEAYEVTDPLAALDVGYAEMKHWELAPHNPRLLNEKGIRFGFTAHGLKQPEEFLKQVRKAVEAGLRKEQALRAMTLTPAQLYRMDEEVGTLEVGKMANFIVTSGDLFDVSSKIQQTWVLGREFENVEANAPDLAGTYDLTVGGKSYKLEVSGDPGTHKAELVVNDTSKVDANWEQKSNRLNLSFKVDNELTRLYGWLEANSFSGNGQLADGKEISWQAVRVGEMDVVEGDMNKNAQATEETMGDVIYPFAAYGSEEIPKQETILFKNAMVWTMEESGILANADVLVKEGKIAQVGENLSAPGARMVDASGKHLTPGIIDEHSHVALSGVNEASESNTAEVRMIDAVDSEDVNIYRQLAGGVTAAQLLHGSANPVGGQSALVKFRWGLLPKDMRIKGADGFIKFALGENVKQSNWGDENTIRFPQTRMGVEQVFVDGFTRARIYEQKWKAYNGQRKKTGPAPRKDLELEAMVEILNDQRFITCHSYVQSEINMLMKVAEQFDFRVNTFTHILEGYKVADKMAAHGAGGSTFADWWAYKFEVREAIPYNAALMTQAGVVTAINSDDREMARRLNQEAAKTVKYGGMSEIEAMKMVTINPAKLLHVDDRMGSIREGKDADLVLWNNHPLSVYATSDMTLVDGTVYFSKDRDAELFAAMKEERARLMKKMTNEESKGKKKPSKEMRRNFHCDDVVFE